MTVEYYIEEFSDYELALCIGTHTIITVYCDGERCPSPLDKDDARDFLETVKTFMERFFPLSEEDAEVYGTTEEASELAEILGDDDADFFECLAKLMEIKEKR